MTPREHLLEIAGTFVGVHEEGGENRGHQVEEFQRAVDGKAEGEPWCAAFAFYCIKLVEAELSVRSPLFKSEHCLTVWTHSPKECRLDRPEPGCLVIWDFGGGKGHVGLVEKIEGERLHTIEGNTGDGRGVVREGDGVYRRDRGLEGSDKMRVLGFLRTFD